MISAPRGRIFRMLVSTSVAVALTGCSTVNSVKRSVVGGPTVGAAIDAGDFIGGVAADEPRAVLIGKQILAQGGSATDAAAAVGFALAVTLPSRASLGAGGACVVYAPQTRSPGGGTPEAILFTSPAPASPAGDRPAAVPMLARGLIAVQQRHGALPMQQVIAPAEQLASFGVPVSRAFAQDLAVVGGALLEDTDAGRLFGSAGTPLAEGDIMTQEALGSTLAELRVRGVSDLYHGQLASTLVSAMPAMGGAISATDLQAAIPRLGTPLILAAGIDRVAFLPPPADGGLAAAAAFQRLQANHTDLDLAQARALGAASAWRHTGADPGSILQSTETPASTLTVLPASTSFVTLDRSGGAVACAISMGNLFGTGRVVPGTGMLLAASPAAVPPPLLASAVAWNPDAHSFRAAIAGSGQAEAALGVAQGMLNTLAAKTAMPSTVQGQARINAMACPRYLPGRPDLCTWATDPRGNGLAVGSN